MPALWQSSQRPMYVRTIWVDGFRHAVLTHDDPHYLKLTRRRPHSSLTCSSKSKRSIKSRIDDDDVDRFQNFNVIIQNDRVLRPDSTGVSKEIDVETLNLKSLTEQESEEFIVKATPQTLNEHDTSRTKFEAFCLNMRNINKINKTARADDDNELSERVLQWLDLAGKVDLLTENKSSERLSQPRHSWPEIKHDKTKSAEVKIEDRNRNETLKSPKVQDTGISPQIGYIDRPYVPFNTIETYARESRNSKHTPRLEKTNDDCGKTKEDLRTKHRDIRTNIAEARRKIASERSAVEKQYADLLSKRMIPEFQTKKQVHIFMPELPKKLNVDINKVDSESLLSQSQLTQLSSNSK